MKKNQLAAMLLTGAVIAISLFNCSKSHQASSPGSNNSQDAQVLPDRPNLNFTANLDTANHSSELEQSIKGSSDNYRLIGLNTTRTGGCGSSFSGSWGSAGYHQYAKDTIKADSSTKTIHINMNVYDVPNRFTVYDSLNNVIAASPWMGFANYSGPWGLSLNTATTGTLNFSRGLYSRFYLLVETSVKTTSDAYIANISCN